MADHPVDEIVEGEWWRDATRSDYVSAFEELVEHGFSWQDAVDLLARLYWAAAGDYGG